MNNILSEVDESKPVEIIKEGKRTGVKVMLLPENGIIISGLKAEWPPWVKLEPKQNRISISLDGMKWEELSKAGDLWILRSLDPRIHFPAKKADADKLGYPYTPFYTPYPGIMDKVEAAPSNVRIEGSETQGPRVSFDFPFSRDRLTLKFSRKRNTRSKRPRFHG